MSLQNHKERALDAIDYFADVAARIFNVKEIIRPKRYFLVGLLLLGLYLYQYLAGLEWPRLQAWQADDVYKQVSGYGLLLIVLYQWRLSHVRNFTNQSIVSALLKNHKWVGAILPLPFFFHAMQPGYAYLFVLATIFLLNIFVALFNTETVKIRCRVCLFTWTLIHIVLALLTLLLVAYHVYIIYAYS